ncbi:MAG TPA: PH domain-containing protein [Candidatus Saccharimonadales bacterium]|nr:PH domain-containing protein [Candidatus Saccharimonadales bacterium]
MISFRQVEEQLKAVGCNFKLWGRAEIRELSNVLMPEEIIAQAVNGTYEGGFAMLCVTNYRVLLIDRKPMLLTIEDVRYDMMSEVDFHNRLMGATIRIFTPMRNLVFNSWSNTRLRKCVNYIQQRVMEIRQHGMIAQQLQTQVNGIPQLPGLAPEFRPQFAQNQPGAAPASYQPINPYTKTPLLSRRRRFPSFY